jgi:hypothetical protein
MKPTVPLLQRALRITLFTRPNCSLCDNARVVLSRVWGKRPFEYEEIDVMKPEGRVWKDLYEFDTPVVRLPLRMSFRPCLFDLIIGYLWLLSAGFRYM